MVLSAEAVVMSATSPSWNYKGEDDDFSHKEGDVINDFDESPDNWGQND